MLSLFILSILWREVAQLIFIIILFWWRTLVLVMRFYLLHFYLFIEFICQCWLLIRLVCSGMWLWRCYIVKFGQQLSYF